MRCDTCKRETDVVLRVMVAKGYNRALAKPLFNCLECFKQKEETKRADAPVSRKPS